MFHAANQISKNPEFSNAELKSVEEVLGVTLPLAYVKLMRVWNVGFLNPRYGISVSGSISGKLRYYLGTGLWPISSIAGISSDRSNLLGLVGAARVGGEKWGLPRRVIPFDGDGHTWVAFDYRVAAEPSIIFIETDEMNFHVVADNFETFVAQLKAL